MFFTDSVSVHGTIVVHILQLSSNLVQFSAFLNSFRQSSTATYFPRQNGKSKNVRKTEVKHRNSQQPQTIFQMKVSTSLNSFRETVNFWAFYGQSVPWLVQKIFGSENYNLMFHLGKIWCNGITKTIFPTMEHSATSWETKISGNSFSKFLIIFLIKIKLGKSCFVMFYFV